MREEQTDMTERIDLTWPDGDGHPMRIVSSDPVSYQRTETVIEAGKKVVKTTRVEYTACTVRPATEAEVRKWRKQR
jgi:hypothetical protein